MSRNWPRVMSPVPGRSTLITSAPNQARSCVQVGPDWTCVKSRVFTPSSALPSLPQGLLDTLGRPLPFAFLATSLRTDFLAALAFLEALSLLFAFLSFFFLAMSFSGRLNVVDAAKTYFLRSLLCGLRLPMRPLSLPAAGSITALMSVGLPPSLAALAARVGSPRVGALDA